MEMADLLQDYFEIKFIEYQEIVLSPNDFVDSLYFVLSGKIEVCELVEGRDRPIDKNDEIDEFLSKQIDCDELWARTKKQEVSNFKGCQVI